MSKEIQFPDHHKAEWEKPELEVCELNQTQGTFGSGGDGGNGRTT